MGYQLDEIVWRHYSLFVPEEDRQSNRYREFWDKLNCGQFQTAEFKRIAKSGKEVWLQASYTPILDEDGRSYEVVKFAADITLAVGSSQQAAALRRAIDNSQRRL